MNTLIYSLSSRQTPDYLKRADEIKVQFRDRKIIPDLAEKYEQARICLELPIDPGAAIDWKELVTNSKLAHDNFIVGVATSEQLYTARNHGLHFYHRAPLHSFQELRDLVTAGVSEVILGSPLFFQLEKVHQAFPDIGVRALVNVALPEGSLSYNNGICGTWIRPEDVDLYSKYITVMEFAGDQSAEQALYRIYAIQRRWPGELNYLVKDLDHGAVNRMIPPECAKARINCGQKCMENGICHLCQRFFDLANPDRLRKYLEDMQNT